MLRPAALRPQPPEPLYADGRVEFIGLDDERPKDKLGVAVGYVRASPRAQALRTDFQQIYGPNWPTRRFEALFTAVYQYEVRDGWTLQPNVLYIVHPGGGATDPLGGNAG
jgi:porin